MNLLLITTLVFFRIFFEFFFKPVYPTMVAIKFQIHGVKITGKYICESNWICLLMPPSKTLPQVFIITNPGKRKLPISPKQCFENLFFPSREGEDYEAKNMTKIKLERVLATSFNKFHSTICNLYFFGFCLVVP